MYRFLIPTLFLATVAAAQPSYEEIISEAVRLERERRFGEQADLPLERAYNKLAEAARLAPGRWEAFAVRGVNRCSKAVVCRVRLGELLSEARARGESPATLKAKEEAGIFYIHECIEAARHDFALMQRNMRARGEVDEDRIAFAKASLKFARAEYLEAEGAKTGAVDDFKALVERGWQADRCSDFVARCYLQLGVAALADQNFADAQAHWDVALRWVKSAPIRRGILTNKAAAYDLDNEFGLAEKIVRKLIELEPKQPDHWKNLGMMLGHQNMLRAALKAYARARDLCRGSRLATLHGNAWLKSAMIHGKLLEEDGDLHLAWRLFLEYRLMLGDDFAFCVNFGEFMYHLGQYELAWTYLERARDQQPFCIMPHQLLLMTAMRMEGPAEEVTKRIDDAREAHKKAQRRFRPREESAELRRVCAGLSEYTAPPHPGGVAKRIDPDPLADSGPKRPPAWLDAAAKQRIAFDPDRPDPDEDYGDEPTAPAPEPDTERRPVPLLWFAPVAILVLIALLVLKRRRPSD